MAVILLKYIQFKCDRSLIDEKHCMQITEFQLLTCVIQRSLEVFKTKMDFCRRNTFVTSLNMMIGLNSEDYIIINKQANYILYYHCQLLYLEAAFHNTHFPSSCFLCAMLPLKITRDKLMRRAHIIFRPFIFQQHC